MQGGYYAERLFALHQRHHASDAARSYVLRWIRNPHPGSFFDLATWWLRDWLPSPVLFWVLKMSGRDSILLFNEDGEVVAHTFFHRRGGRVYMFNVVVRHDCRGNSLSERILARELLPYCLARWGGGVRVRLSAGNEGTRRQATLFEQLFLRFSGGLKKLFYHKKLSDQLEEQFDAAPVMRVYDKIVCGRSTFLPSHIAVRAEAGYWLVLDYKEEEVSR